MDYLKPWEREPGISEQCNEYLGISSAVPAHSVDTAIPVSMTRTEVWAWHGQRWLNYLTHVTKVSEIKARPLILGDWCP